MLTLGTEGLFTSPPACHPIMYSRILPQEGHIELFLLGNFSLASYWSKWFVRVRNADSGRKT
jgi:hypothetical protein